MKIILDKGNHEYVGDIVLSSKEVSRLLDGEPVDGVGDCEGVCFILGCILKKDYQDEEERDS